MQNKMLEKGLIFFVRPSNIFVRITYMVSVLVFFDLNVLSSWLSQSLSGHLIYIRVVWLYVDCFLTKVLRVRAK